MAEHLQSAEKDALTKMREPKLHFSCRDVVNDVWSNYSNLTRPHPKWWFSMGNPLISGKPRLVKYNNLARMMSTAGPRSPSHVMLMSHE